MWSIRGANPDRCTHYCNIEQWVGDVLRDGYAEYNSGRGDWKRGVAEGVYHTDLLTA